MRVDRTKTYLVRVDRPEPQSWEIYRYAGRWHFKPSGIGYRGLGKSKPDHVAETIIATAIKEFRCTVKE